MSPKNKTALIVGALAFAAFVTGYKKDDLNSLFTSSTDVAETTQTADVVDEKTPPTAPQMFTYPNNPVAPPPPRPMIDQEPQKSGPKLAVRNPYAEMMKQVEDAKQENQPQGRWASAGRPFGGTLDSIQGKTDNSDKVKRKNAYFEKLSQQMKQLQNKDQEVNHQEQNINEDVAATPNFNSEVDNNFIPEEEPYIEEEFTEEILEEEQLLREEEMIADVLEDIDRP